MSRLRAHRGDLLLLGLLLVLPLFWFAPVLFPVLSQRTLLPFDNLFTFEPWHSLRPDLLPHNALLSDLVLENAVWKLHIRRTLADGQLPLWNPQIFTGLPFLAAGQASTFYPLSLFFYILPLAWAYGWFTALQIGLAGINLYLFGRVLGLRPLPALCAGIIYQFSGFVIVSVVFTMFIAAVAWLPLLLAIIEYTVRKQEAKGTTGYNPTPAIAAGAIAIGCVVLAGHPELIYYTLLVAGVYTGTRLFSAWRRLGKRGQLHSAPGQVEANEPRPDPHTGSAHRILTLANWLLAMALLGIGMGAVQLIPLLELLPLNFRAGSASLEQVRGWAWPTRHLFTFWLPDLFGNPSHHRWFDIWKWTWTPATVNALGEPNATIFWGIKNYVEGGSYLSIGAWLLAAMAIARAFAVAVAARLRTGAASAPEQTATTFAAAVAPLPARPEQTQYGESQETAPVTAGHAPWFFGGLALLSLAFAFGTPLYAILYYGLPGWNQLHSPFRWVFPFTLSMAVLSGIGLQGLLSPYTAIPELSFLPVIRLRRVLRAPAHMLAHIFAYITLAAGLAALLVVVASLWQPQRFIAWGQRLLDSSMLAQMAFQNGRMFWSYQTANLVRFGIFATLVALLVLLIARRAADKPSRKLERSWLSYVTPAALILLIFLDLYVAHGRFNPAAPVTLSPLENRPPAVEFLNTYATQKHSDADSSEGENPVGTGLWRFTTFNVPGEKTFQANTGMYYGWQDIRGYDSIIPAQYVQLMERIAPQANELLYNQIAPLYAVQGGDVYAPVDNPLLDLLNVEYILTEHYLPNPTWREIYRDEAIGVYENSEVMPRVFMVPGAEIAAAPDQPLLSANLRERVFIETDPREEHALLPGSPQLAEARISRYTANEVFVDLNLSDRGWLVFTDAYFPGWKAFMRPFGGNEGDESEITIYRANGAFRTVYIPRAGQWTVRFVYSPMSFKLGLYTSFVAFMALLLLTLYWGWGKFYRPESTAGEIRTVAKNSLIPMGLSLTNKAIDFAFAMLYVRLLGPDGTGKYAFVVAIYGFFEIISRYGLGTLLTRDVAADKNQSSRYLTNVLALRTLLWLASLPLLALVTTGFRNVELITFLDASNIGRQEVQAIAVFALSMLFANWADAFSSMFYAFEKMEYPAGLANVMALVKVTVGALVLLLGGGFVGLAAVSLGLNILQVLWLYHLLRSTLFQPEWHWDWSLQRLMMRTSGPLMINHLLATIFWRIDLWILRPLAGAASVGLYSVGLKYLDGLNIVPSVFTMAVFPLMSRYARQGQEGAPDNLLRAYVLSLRLLVIVSLPVAVAVTALAEPLVWLVGGGEYLNVTRTYTWLGRSWTISGGSDLALRVIIWSIPIGFVNSVTQYVLIAVDQQRFLTRAFVIGVVFNIAGNLLAIPRFGFVGAAVVTILSEFSLLIPFYSSVRRHVGTVPWLRICAAPLLAMGMMGIAIYLLAALQIPVWIGVLASCPLYLGVLLLTGAFRGDDMATLRRALPFWQ